MKTARIAGIFGLFLGVFLITALASPQFVSAYNLTNLIRWTALFGILSVGVSFVIITGGIDLSIGSVVGLTGCLLPWLLVHHGWSAPAALLLVVAVSAFIGLAHGLLITRLGLQPFVVTLCGLLVYRGLARWLTDDQTQGFGNDWTGLRTLATGEPFSLAALATVGGGLAALVLGLRPERGPGFLVAAAVALLGGASWAFGIPLLSELPAPAPFLVLLVVAVLAALFLNETVWGRHLYALGQNETAARYSGIRTERLTVAAYVLCSLLAGIGGVLFALDVNSIQPAMHGNFYELYAIAAAVLGGCSLRGGEGAVLGVVIGAAVMRVLYNSINLLEIPTQLEFAIIGAVILLGVCADVILKRVFGRRAGGAAGGAGDL